MMRYRKCICLVFYIVILQDAADGFVHGQRTMFRFNNPNVASRNAGVNFPPSLNMDIMIESEDIVTTKAPRKRNVYLPTKIDVNERERSNSKYFRNTETAFYVDDTGSFAFTTETGKDGQVKTHLRGIVRPRRGRKCWINREEAHCWDVHTEGVYDYVDSDDQSRTPIPTREQIVQMLGSGGQSWEDYRPDRVVKILYVIDMSVKEWIFDRRGDENDLYIYTYLMNNEASVMYDSVRMRSFGLLSIQLYAVDVIFPDTEEFEFITNHLDGELLDVARNNDLNQTDAWDDFATFYNNISSSVASHDVAAIISRRPMIYGTTRILGTAAFGAICARPKNETIVWNVDGYDDVAFTLAHELAHSLGAYHDDAGVPGCRNNAYLMANGVVTPTLFTRSTFRTFSWCSVAQMFNHLNSYPQCLREYPSDYLSKLCDGFRANNFSLSFNCYRATGLNTSDVCSPDEARDRKIVSSEACWDDGIVRCTDANGTCSVPMYNLHDGTPCNGQQVGTNYMCFAGRCVEEFDICENVSEECSCTQNTWWARRACCRQQVKIDGGCCTGCVQMARWQRCIPT